MVSSRKPALGLLVLDALALFITFNLTAIVRGIRSVADTPVVQPLLIPFILLAVAIHLIDGYNRRTDTMSLDYTSQHCIALFTALLVTGLITFAVVPEGYSLQQSRAVIALGFIGAIPLTLSYRRYFYREDLKRRANRRIVFVGDEITCSAFRDECEKFKVDIPVIYSTPILGTASPFHSNSPTLTPFRDVVEQWRLGEIEIEALVLRESNRDIDDPLSQQLVELYFAGVPCYTLELFHYVYWRNVPLYRLNQTWLYQEGFQLAREPIFVRIKRMSDIALSLLALGLFSPVIILACIAIWLEDRGPVFFQQTRIGRNREPFKLLKLRTMRVQQTAGNLYTQKGDSRITKVGAILRATRIDEFPQVINVLRGEMSFIGPRAEWDKLVTTYEAQIPCYHFRHLMKPGITGWAQVNYPYGANLEDTVRKLEYDLYYVRHFSFILDASIVLKTVHVMLFGKGR